MFKTTGEQRAIAAAKTVEAIFKAALKFHERQNQRGSFGIVIVFAVHLDIAIKPHDQSRHERPRNDITRKHREHDGFRQRHKQITRDAGEKKHRHEHDANAQRRDERGQCDFLRAFQNSIFQWFAIRHVVMNIFNRHGRVVHENSDCECKSAERHQIDGFAERA